MVLSQCPTRRRLALAGFSSLKGLFSGKMFLRKNIFFPEKFPEK